MIAGFEPSFGERMSKRITVRRSDLNEYRVRLEESAEQTQLALADLAGGTGPLEFLLKMKFYPVGCDPLDSDRPLNLVEQLNQTFTYLASFNGAERLFERHPDVTRLTLNLGTSSGFDIETHEGGGVVAEVFASVTPKNNGKLLADVEKVSASEAFHRYVLFMSPGHLAGIYRGMPKKPGVVVLSLGCDL